MGGCVGDKGTKVVMCVREYVRVCKSVWGRGNSGLGFEFSGFGFDGFDTHGFVLGGFG